MPDKTPHSLAGQTMLWEFNSGPTANKVYEHTFNDDGTVDYRQVEDPTAEPAQGAEDRKAGAKEPTRYASFAVSSGMHLVSYLSDMGWTLTVHVNTADQLLHGFASNDKEWFPVTGTIVG